LESLQRSPDSLTGLRAPKSVRRRGRRGKEERKKDKGEGGKGRGGTGPLTQIP